MVSTTAHFICSDAIAAEKPLAVWPAVERKGRFIYQRLPLKLRNSTEMKQVISTNFDVFTSYIERNVPIKLAADIMFEKLHEAEGKLDSLIDSTKAFNSLPAVGGIKLSTFMPWNAAAFIIYVGGKISASIKMVTGASFTIGFLFRPMEVHRYDTITKTTEVYVEYEYDAILWPNFDVGIGTKSSNPVFEGARAGIGFVWGELQKLSDFRGMAIAGTTNLLSSRRVSAKFGVLNQAGVGGFFDNPFATIGVELGTSLERTPPMDLRVATGVILSFSSAMKMLGLESFSDTDGSLK